MGSAAKVAKARANNKRVTRGLASFMGKREKRKGSEVNSLPTPLQGGEGSESHDGDVEFSSEFESNWVQVEA